MIHLINNPQYFNTPEYQSIVDAYFDKLLKDDGQDITSNLFFSKDHSSSAKIIAKSSGIIAGISEIAQLLNKQNLKYKANKQDKDTFQKKDTIIEIGGNTRTILKTERIILNLLTRMSSIATFTNKLTKLSQKPLAATRKTLYGPLDKKAIHLGGGLTHRINLADAIMVKDTHWDHYNRDIQTLLQKIQNPQARFIDIETSTPQEAIQLIKHLPQQDNIVVMLDNFTPQQIKETTEKLHKLNLRNKVILEASGGINEQNLQEYSNTDIDFISMGSLTKGGRECVDFSMKYSHQKAK